MTLVGNEAEAQALVAETEIVGIIGASLTGVLFLITSWRLIFHSWGCCDCRFPDRQHAAFISEGAHQMDTGFLGGGIPGGLTMRRAYHVLLWMAMSCELSGYIILAKWGDYMTIYDKDEQGNKHTSEVIPLLGLIFLNIIGGSILEYSAYSIVTIKWFQSTARARAGGCETKRIFCIYPTILVFCGTTLIAGGIDEITHLIMALKNQNGNRSDDAFDWNEWTVFTRPHYNAHQRRYLLDGVAWTIHGVLVMVCCGMMYRRLRRTPQWHQLPQKKKFYMVTRIYTVMILCVACYLLRATVLLFLAIWIRNEVASNKPWLSAFWIGCKWIPTVVPSALQLYAFRKRDRSPNYIEGGRALLPCPVPPEELFDAFKRSIYEVNALDESFNSGGEFEKAGGGEHEAFNGEMEYVFEFNSSDDESRATS